MNKIKTVLVFIIVGTLIGLILAFQFKSKVPRESEFPLDQIEIQKALLQSYTDEQHGLEAELARLRDDLDKVQEKNDSGRNKALKQTLQKLQESAGYSSVAGSGVEIFLADSVNVTRETVNPQDDALIHAADLRDIINLLFSADSEAVAVNGKRVLPLFSVNVVGNTFFIHDFYAFPPFTITAIGPEDVLKARLLDESLLPFIHKRVKNKKIRFVAEERSSIEIPAFSGLSKVKFLKSHSAAQ